MLLHMKYLKLDMTVPGTGFKILGLAEDGVGWALDEHNAKLVTSAMKSKVEQVREGILSGKIKT